MVMPIRPTVAAAQASGGALAFGVAVHDEIDAGDAEREAGPLPRRHPLAEQPVRQRRGQDRLQAHHQRGKARRQLVVDRDEHAAEIAAMHEQAGHRAVQHARARRPGRPGQQNDQRRAPAPPRPSAR